METREELIAFAQNMIDLLDTDRVKISDAQIRAVNSLLAFKVSDDQLARIDEIINE